MNLSKVTILKWLQIYGYKKIFERKFIILWTHGEDLNKEIGNTTLMLQNLSD